MSVVRVLRLVQEKITKLRLVLVQQIVPVVIVLLLVPERIMKSRLVLVR